MIVLDTSALLCTAFEAPRGDDILALLETAGALVNSAATLAQTLMLARRRVPRLAD